MDDLLTPAGAVLFVVLFVAIAIALWEHGRRRAADRRRRAAPNGEPAGPGGAAGSAPAALRPAPETVARPRPNLAVAPATLPVSAPASTEGAAPTSTAAAAADGPSEKARRAAAVERTLERLQAESGDDRGWQDTEPMIGPGPGPGRAALQFAETMPADLELELPPPR